ncbi:MAG TPA: ATP-binding protein [Gemmatimonadales bacterium]
MAGGLILLVGLSVSSAAYYEVRSAAEAQARQRVRDLASLIGDTQRNGLQLAFGVQQIAKRPGLTQLGADPDLQHQADALAALLQHASPQIRPFLLSQVLDSSGQEVLSTLPWVHPDWTDFPPRIAPGENASIGRMRIINGVLVYPVSARIPDGSGRFVVQWRRVINPRQQSLQLRQLTGTEVSLGMGNRDGSYWSNFDTVVARPPVPLDSTRLGVSYVRDPAVGPVTAGILPLADTPFSLSIEVPMRAVHSSSDAFFRRMLAITLLCVAVGVAAAWWFARRLAAPLVSLTRAVDALGIDHGDHHPATGDRDEIEGLNASFISMSEQVTESHQRLEEKVHERTAELDAALTALQEAQEALVRRERLAMLGQLAGSVGHELRNPLGVMSNAIYYLEMVLQPATDDVRDYLKLLRDQVGLSTKIVSDLLDSARVTPAQRRMVDLGAVIAAQTERLGERVAVRIETDLGEQAPMAEVDPVQVGQIIFNLLTNAVQAMGESGGTVSIRSCPAGDQMVALQVSDTGPGIAAADSEKIFEPLFTTKARGIGLGLAVSRALARANMGDLTVSSAPGQGAQFTILMPAATVVSG